MIATATLLEDDHRKIEVQFFHDPNVRGFSCGRKEWKGVMICTIIRTAKDETKYTERAIDAAFCSVTDSFEEHEGRKVSFGRAVSRMYPGINFRELRGLLWDRLFYNMGGKR